MRAGSSRPTSAKTDHVASKEPNLDRNAGTMDFQPSRLEQLSTDFAALAPKLADSPEKQALSLLHGMIQELWRTAGQVHPSVDSFGATLDDLKRLHEHAPAMEGDAISTPLSVGTQAPDFRLKDAGGREIGLASYAGKTVVLVFYPLDWSPGCSKQLDLYQQELSEFERRGVEIVGISVDSLYSHGAWGAARGLSIPLLADFNPKGAVARRYNVWRDADGFSERALYIVDGEGVIRYAHVSPKLQHVPDIYELFDKLDELSGAPVATGGRE